MTKPKTKPKSIVQARKAFEIWGFTTSYYYPENERYGMPPILRISSLKEMI